MGRSKLGSLASERQLFARQINFSLNYLIYPYKLKKS